MSVAELKTDLHRIIEAIEDEKILSTVHSLLSSPSLHWNDLSKKTKASIEKGMAEIKAGQGKDAWEVLEKYKKYL